MPDIVIEIELEQYIIHDGGRLKLQKKFKDFFDTIYILEPNGIKTKIQGKEKYPRRNKTKYTL